MNSFEEKQKNHKKKATNTTFICVLRDSPTNMDINNLKLPLKQNGLPITNVTRIINDKGPLPHVRVFTKQNPNLVSPLMTNGISIGFNRYKVEESRTRGRPFACRSCL